MDTIKSCYERPTQVEAEEYYFNLPIFNYFGPEQCDNIYNWDAKRTPLYQQQNDYYVGQNFLEETILVAKYNPKDRSDPLKCYFGTQRRAGQNEFEDATHLGYLGIDTQTDLGWLEELASEGVTSGMLRDTKTASDKHYEAGLLFISESQDDRISSREITGIPHLDIINTARADMSKEEQTKVARKMINLIKFHIICSFQYKNNWISVTLAEYGYYFVLPVFRYFGLEHSTTLFDWDDRMCECFAGWLVHTVKYDPHGWENSVLKTFLSMRRGENNARVLKAKQLEFLDLSMDPWDPLIQDDWETRRHVRRPGEALRLVFCSQMFGERFEWGYSRYVYGIE